MSDLELFDAFPDGNPVERPGVVAATNYVRKHAYDEYSSRKAAHCAKHRTEATWVGMLLLTGGVKGQKAASPATRIDAPLGVALDLPK